MLYNSAVHRSVISELRRRAGRVFGNTYPDVYSGFAIAHVIGRYPSIEVPMTVAGSSGDSYGIATLFRRGASPLDQDFRDLNEEARLPMHRAIPNLPSFPAVPVADSFLLAKEALFPTDETIVLDRKIFTAHCVGGLRAQDAAEWRRSLEALGAILDDDRSLRLWFDETFLRMKPSLGPVRLRTAPLGYDGSFLHLDTSLFGVADVCGAVTLCERILNYRASGIPLPEDSLRRARAASSSTDLMQIKVQPRAWRTEVAARPVLAALRRLAEAGRVGVTHGWQRLLRLRSGRERP
jgi:hypothetical protein